ncbi:hypothetical protein OGAPHI_003984 [Ogataea philodendri]|uniref:Exoribonuclease phosphorolytic domain-containing protein n=1 Tax=Ogataea philodendri TaxID=1378263 RepID=A0A9P8T5D6_9ASCO|nr:uncharacterized protein OGAPHI_003984 [Ogataea philodendri]KAH3665796.1 hypothetical protein OGAPHI_003984 [Ogataea philodendri]
MSFTVKNDPLDQVDGSASFEFGATKVISSVTGPIESSRPRNELPTKAYLDINIRPASGTPSTKETLLEHKLSQILSTVIDLDQFPRQTIQIAVQVLKTGEPKEFAARQLVAIINSVYLALLNSGVSLKTSFLATCCSVDLNGTITTDPSSAVLANSVSHYVVAYTLNNDKVNDLVFCDALGNFTQDQLFAVLDQSASNIQSGYHQLRLLISDHVTQNYGTLGLVELLLHLLDLLVQVDHSLDHQVNGASWNNGSKGTSVWDVLGVSHDSDTVHGLDQRDNRVGLVLSNGSILWFGCLHIHLGVFRDVVLGKQRSGALSDFQHQLVSFVGLDVVVLLHVLWVLGLDDGLTSFGGSLWKSLPHFLGNERHEWMDESQSAVNSSVQSISGRFLLSVSSFQNQELGVLNVNVTKVVQPEVVDGLGDIIELSVLDSLVSLLSTLRQFVQDPLLNQCLVTSQSPGGRRNVVVSQSHQNELGSLEDLVTKLTVSSNSENIKVDISTTSGVGTKCKSQSISTTFWDTVRVRLFLNTSDNIDWVDHVTKRLAHLSSLSITHQRVAENLLEWNLSSHLDTKHNHSGNPEEQNIPSGLQHGSRVEVLHVLGLVWPSQGGEWPQSRGEPGVQNVFVLVQGELLSWESLLSLSLCLFLCSSRNPILAVVSVVGLSFNVHKVDRTSVSPPELSGNTPVLDVLQPSEVLCLRALWSDGNFSVLDCINSGIGHFLLRHPPLRFQIWLDNVTGSGADRQSHLVVLLANEKALLLQLLDNQRSGIESLDTFPLTTVGIQLTIIGEDIDEFQLVSLTGVVIVRVVTRSDLHGTSTKLHVDCLGVGNDWKLSVQEWMLHKLSVEMCVSWIFRVHGNSSVTENGLRTSGSNNQLFVRAHNRVGKRGQHTKFNLLFVTWDRKKSSRRNNLVVHLQVGQSSRQLHGPVDQSQVTVDGSLFVKSDECFNDSLGQFWRESEGLSGPVVRSTKHLELVLDLGVVHFFPVPDLADELFTAQIVSGRLFLGPQSLLNDRLCSNTSMVESRQEQNSLAFHSVVSY